MKKLDTILFDWAGTTIDFGCFAPLSAFIGAFGSKGITISLDEARGPMGMKKVDHVRTILEMPRIAALWAERFHAGPSEKDVQEIYEEFERQIFTHLEEHCRPLPGVVDAVDELKTGGIKIGSTTGYTGAMMEIVVPEARKLGYSPDSVVTSTDVPEGRPAPFMIWQNAINLVSPDLRTICKVGDTVSDIREGVNAGVWSVGVIVGSSEWALNEEDTARLSDAERRERETGIRYKFLRAGAHFVIQEMRELPSLVEVINERLAEDRGPR
jgi:phosphonoacetaldehyde hydrolase